MIPSDFTPYDLTPEQVRDGWTVSKLTACIGYLDPNRKLQDPATGVPAYQAWYTNGAERLRIYYLDNSLNNPSSDQPAYNSWRKDGTKRYEAHFCGGACVSEACWADDGQQKGSSQQKEYKNDWFKGHMEASWTIESKPSITP